MPREIAAFVNDASPDATQKLIDRLLADPQYGERWGRHWLDLTRYADSNGYENDGDRPNAYPYRDFVVQAFNDDLPYNTFLAWQLAGDEILPGDGRAVAATGFLTAGPLLTSNTQLEDEIRRYRYDELDDVLSTTGGAMLGLTVGCARCHDHKYDAIPTRDYYRLQAAFIGTKRQDVELTLADGVRQKALVVVEPGSTPAPGWLVARGDPMNRREQVSLGFLSVLCGPAGAEPYLEHVRAEPGARSDTPLQRAA